MREAVSIGRRPRGHSCVSRTCGGWKGSRGGCSSWAFDFQSVFSSLSLFFFFLSPSRRRSQPADPSCVFTQNTVKWRKVILVGILKMVPVSLRSWDRNVMTSCEWCQSALWWETDNGDLCFWLLKESRKLRERTAEHVVHFRKPTLFFFFWLELPQPVWSVRLAWRGPLAFGGECG